MHLVERVKAILRRPQSEWPVIAREPGDPTDLFTGYVAILALVPAIAGFIGVSIVGVRVGGGSVARLSVISGLFSAIFGYLLTFVVVYLIGVLINVLAPSFGGRRGFEKALRLAVYSFTPYWLAGVFMLVPAGRALAVLGLYGGYLTWVGLPFVMGVPRQRALLMAIAIVACAVALALVVGGLQATIFALRRGA